MKVPRADLTEDVNEAPPPSLGGLVHGVVNSTASIAFSASALRAAGKLSEFDLEALARIEQAAALVTDTVKRFAASAPTERTPGLEARGIVDLYDLCCAIAEEHRRVHGRAIFCRAFGDSRGPWKHAQIVELVNLMVDSAFTYLGASASLTIVASGIGRHVRLSVHGLGVLSAEAKEACLQIPARVDASLGGLMTVTVSRGPGTVLSMHLPR